MIMNKGAYERGFGHGCVYKSYIRELNDQSAGNSTQKSRFRMFNSKKDLAAKTNVDLTSHGLESDGLPFIGKMMNQGDSEMVVYDKTLDKAKFTKFKDNECARIENIRLMSDEKNSTNNVNVGYTIRYPRNPVIGDKFSSRHGQKGVMSVVWPQEDMPFTGSGITPDIIINPHAFPSRMTIGMLIESLAGKGGCLDGKFIDTKTFEKYEDDDAIDFFGKELVKHGYNYYGNETMYSGIFGEEMKVEIFMGVVYY